MSRNIVTDATAEVEGGMEPQERQRPPGAVLQRRKERQPEGEPERTLVHDFHRRRGQGCLLRRLPPRQGRGLGVGGRGRRHLGRRGPVGPKGGRTMGRTLLPEGHEAPHHCRLRRLQWISSPGQDDRARQARKRWRARGHRMPTTRRAPRSGTRSSTACSASSR
jgi:hypothetical protein